jgi:uncharacterized LabA/DUF88 family protein
MGIGIGIGSNGTGRGFAKVSPVIYKLIDGDFLRKLCADYSREIGFDIWGNINWSHITQKQRTFFYDSLPVKKSSQTEKEFDEAFSERAGELDRLSRLPDLFVKNGASRFNKKEGLKQKGVDILLATDAILFAHRGIADELHIYTNDLDFFPVFEALQSTSCRGRLYHSHERPPSDLIPFADSAEPVGFNFLLEACGKGWGHAASIYTSAVAYCNEDPFITGQSLHGDLFEIRYDPVRQVLEVRYWVNGGVSCIVTESAILAYGVAEKFMRVLPNDLLQRLRAKMQD